MKLDKFKKVIENTTPEKKKEISDMMDRLKDEEDRYRHPSPSCPHGGLSPVKGR